MNNSKSHKERSQLAHRARFGLLEKHKDYVTRARDYHSKQDRLIRLRRKAAVRNKDEFYFSMIRQRTKNGVHVQSRANAALPTDFVKLLKTQDENYVRTIRSSGLKKIDKIKSQLTQMSDLVDSQSDLNDDQLEVLKKAEILNDSRAKVKSKHVLFAESTHEASLLSKNASKIPVVDTQVQQHDEEDDLGWKSTQPKSKSNSKKHNEHDPEVANRNRQQHIDRRNRLLKELSARLDRDRKLRYAQREFEMQRLMMGKGARSKIQAVEKVDDHKDDDEEDEDELDARRGKHRRRTPMNEEIYRPRVYKWRLERKK